MKKLVILSVGLSVAVLFFAANVMAQSEGTKDQPAAGQQIKFKPKEVKVSRKHNGVVDRIEVYGDDGKIKEVETDTTGNGKMDEWIYYENGIAVKGEKDANHDGKVDTTIFYDAKGAVIRTETATKGDGKVNEWVYYENGRPVKAEKDTSGSGKPDTWITY